MRFLASVLLLLACGWSAAAGPLRFPRDYGAHPEFKTEWWYVTGWLERPKQQSIGFQITFFRSATGLGVDNPSRFAPKQLIIAHAALSDPQVGRLLVAQKRARAGFDIAYAKPGDTALKLDNWSLTRLADGSYQANIVCPEFTLELQLQPRQSVLLQGEQGLSRKGKSALATSFYYSEPQLQTKALIKRRGKETRLQGVAWLDHEWANQVVDTDGSGWDWLGANLDDGSALMAFQMRGKDGKVLWANASLRDAHANITQYGPEQVSFTSEQYWLSPRTAVRYPVVQQVRLSNDKGSQVWRTEPLQSDQELDARPSTGIMYWEGAVNLWQNGQIRGLGYLEMTGYDRPVKL
jgi:predicted secreted hydrolase